MAHSSLSARQPSPSPSPSAQPAPAAGDWASIIFASGSISATLDGNGNYLSGSTLDMRIQYAGGNGATAALKIGGTSPYLANLSVSNSQTEGIDIQGGTVSVVGAGDPAHLRVCLPEPAASI